MTDPGMDALRDEYRIRPDRVGPLIFGEVQRAARLAYGAAALEDAVDDLVQETFAGALLGENQLDYIMDVATNLDEFRRLLFKHVRRSAGRVRRREHTIVDNLIRRSRELLSQDPFVAETTATEMTYRLATQQVENRVPTQEEKWLAAVRASAVPKALPRQDPRAEEERAPVVYPRRELIAVLTAIADALPTPVADSDLREIFEQLLTDWFPVFLVEEREPSVSGGAELSPDEETVVNDIADRILDRVETGHPELATVLQLDLAGVRDEDIRIALGVGSRGTVISRHKMIEQIMREEMGDQGMPVANAVLRELGVRLGERGRPGT
jgi:DNA-directed RNA polymerase specialized sigma24 family protein